MSFRGDGLANRGVSILRQHPITLSIAPPSFRVIMHLISHLACLG
jgi:hypothetical protein